MDRGKEISCPLPSYVKLSKRDCLMFDEDKVEMDKLPYASVVGSLMYAMISTRPDIAFAMGVASRYMSNPWQETLGGSERDHEILKATKHVCICYASQDLSVKGYSDSDYAGDLDKRRSTSGYVFTLTGGAVSWRSQLQDCVTQSNTEAKYVAASEASKESIWLG